MWYYVQNGQACGPVETDVMLANCQNGVVGPETLVWKQGMSNWLTARSFPELPMPSAMNQGPPPIPPEAGIPPLTLPPRPGPSWPDTEAVDIEQNKVLAVLAYIGIFFLIPLLAAPRSRFARYHTNQGLVLFVSSLAIWAVTAILAAVPLLNIVTLPVTILTWFLLPIAILAFIVIGIIHAASGEFKPLPLIGHFRLLN
jgi:uncharacterized membrane protein